MSKRFPRVTAGEIIKLLKKDGFKLSRQSEFIKMNKR